MNSFPLKRNAYLNLDELKNTFNKFKSRPIVSFTEKNITNKELDDFHGLIIFKNSTSKRYSDITEYFQEHVRIDAKRYDQELSPAEYWDSNKDELENKDILMQRKNISKNLKECTNFCPLILVKIVKIFKSKDILDFSAGWGDRLVGACLCDDFIKSYTGIDPNKRLFTGYKKIIKEFVPKNNIYKYNMINGCSEDIIDTFKCKFDLILTSPPYYDLEIYSNDKNQSTNRYKSFELWYNKFLLKCINSSINKLKENGIVAININNFKNYDIIGRLKKDIKIKYLGIIYFGNHRCKTTIYQPILLWQNVI